MVFYFNYILNMKSKMRHGKSAGGATKVVKKRDQKVISKPEGKMKKQKGSNQDRLAIKMTEGLKSSKFRYLNE